MGGVESFEAKHLKTESVSSEVNIETQKEVSSKVKSEQSDEVVRENVIKSEVHEETQNVATKAEQKSQESKKEESISMTLPISRETREKSAEDKLEELDTKLRFVQMIRGTSVEREYIVLIKLNIFSGNLNFIHYVLSHLARYDVIFARFQR